jgi:hypothetical protein
MFNYYPYMQPQYFYYYSYPNIQSYNPIPEVSNLLQNDLLCAAKDNKPSQSSTGSTTQVVYKRCYQIGKKILRNFLNEGLRRILNKLLRLDKPEVIRYLKKFKPSTIYNLNTSKVKLIISKTMRELFDMDGDAENLKIINVHAKENNEFQKFLDLPFDYAYSYYLEGDEFEIEKSKLASKNDNDYVAEYDYYAKNFLDRYRKKNPNKKAKEM